MPEVDSFGLSEVTVTAIRSVFSRYPAVSRADVYGSRAKGNHRAGSDIDLTVFGDGLTADDLLKIDRDIEDLDLPYRVDLSVYALIEDPALRSHIDRVGQVLYQATRN